MKSLKLPKKTKNLGPLTEEHPGRSYEAECARMSNEIAILKAKISKTVV